MLNTISSNAIKSHQKILKQEKHHTKSDAERFEDCNTGLVLEYMKRSSQFDKLYDI